MSAPAGAAWDVVVAGGGISGLVCAYELKKRGQRVLLLEASEHVGGLIQTERREGFLLEHGPQNFQSSERLDQLISELGVASDLVRADPRAPRFICLDGSLHPAPLGLLSLLRTRLLSRAAKLRLLREPFIAPAAQPDESAAEFFRRRFGPEVAKRLVEPFLAGVYAGDAERLSLPAVFPELARWESESGSVVRGFLKSRGGSRGSRRQLCSFRGGIEQLPRALAAHLGGSLWKRARLLAVQSADGLSGARYRLEVDREGNTEVLATGALVLAVPPAEAARLLRGLAPDLAGLLEGIECAPLAVLWVRCPKSRPRQFPGGFGFLVPRTEGLLLRGVVFSSELFPGRAPEDWTLFTAFVGGTGHAHILRQSDEDLARIALEPLQRLLGLSQAGEPLGVRRHERAIPQYNLGHLERCRAISEQEARLSGVFLTGNYLRGISLAHCADHAADTANRVAEFLRLA